MVPRALCISKCNNYVGGQTEDAEDRLLCSSPGVFDVTRTFAKRYALMSERDLEYTMGY